MKFNLFRKKSVNEFLESSENGDKLNRVLGPFSLMFLGIGFLIGAGIFILTGTASAFFAGPAITISFIFCTATVLLAALCYTEFATMVPLAGSAYTYSYITLGEIWAWIIGWDIILEYMVIVATVAIGWSSYFVAVINSLGLYLPAALTNPPGINGGIINLPAIIIVFLIMSLLITGVKESSKFNNVIVAIKLAVIFLFIIIGIKYIHPSNYSPFFPYGLTGVFKGAGIVMFAYIGFDTLTTAAEEVKNPQKTIPIAILGALIISSILYIVVATILNGMFPYYIYKDVAAPVAFALQQVGFNWASAVVSVGALCGLTSVILVGLFGQSRILYAISRDGLLPGIFSRLHPTFKTPFIGLLFVSTVSAVLAAFTPIEMAVQLANIGSLAAFIIVALAVMILRWKSPEIPRPFKTPLMPVIPILAIIFCSLLIVTLPLLTQVRFIIWLSFGLIIYYFYGRKNSKLNGNI